MPAYNYKKGLTAMLGCFFIWGFQPLYWYLCGGMDTFFLMASRIVWAAGGGFDDYHRCRHKRQLEHHMENLTGISAPVRPLPCVVPCQLYFVGDEAT